MIADVVVAAMTPDVLRDALPAIHRSGLGHTARVMRAERGDLRAQLRRAGVPVESGPARLAAEELVLMVAAAGRSPAAATLLLGSGAQATWIVSPSGFWRQIDDAVLAPNLVEPPPREDRQVIPAAVAESETAPPVVSSSTTEDSTAPA
jgi:hypothetical protein